MFRKSEQWILKELLAEDNQSQTELMRSTDLCYSTIMSNIQDLKSKGLVEIRQVGSDNRVTLTQKGRKAAEFFWKNWAR